ncbi:sigma-70 family RNA polymerase sigma factor [Pandoraea fibrosis]|uniref:Sigma-70 family RNA polymerase sigma factor n=1 Tax=Pandoraea fibrosis TaxID=1891094 RepID=A0ABX6HSR1_9BURK|nr:sigma-70 family RNA polymerase sigma factor [Pandoraea fibrosis]QHE92556.1 sigma-70 family RNA polymerase sigma factor [Pandoraea fibrosis]QHF13888.1 sigma-70 family RNA polymerase sigma factor [Pandoraea fibrosis]
MSTSTRSRGLFAYYDELLRTWTGKLSNRHQAEDIAQDSLLRVLEMEIQPEQPRAYLHQTARNIAIDAYRRDGAREQTELDALANHEATTGNPEDEVHAVQLALAVERALAELPLKCRQVFVWQRIDGYSQQEIAARLDISKNMVEKYMIRAMKHLRERLGALAPQ